MHVVLLYALGIFILCTASTWLLRRWVPAPFIVAASVLATACGFREAPISEARAIELAKAEIQRREGAQPYARFTANHDARERNWVVTALYEPEKPGGHLFLLISDDGRVVDYAPGR